MTTIDILAGMHIEDAARQLVAMAPARAMFSGVWIRARYATTRPEDIVRQWEWQSTLRDITWRNSPRGRAVLAAEKRKQVAAQTTIDHALKNMPDMTDPASVLRWFADVSRAMDQADVVYDRAAYLDAFAAGGWMPGANCYGAFDDGDARNYAGWIVGQCLKKAWDVVRFIPTWFEKFQPDQVN